MNLRIFSTRLEPEFLATDQETINRFMESVTVTKTSTQFVPGNPDYWSILVFYENGQSIQSKETAKAAEPVTTAQLTEDEQAIVNALKIWRKERATELNVPEYLVCHNATLITLARQKPQQLSGLAQIKGLGEQKIARYGDDIVAILNAF